MAAVRCSTATTCASVGRTSLTPASVTAATIHRYALAAATVAILRERGLPARTLLVVSTPHTNPATRPVHSAAVAFVAVSRLNATNTAATGAIRFTARS